MKKIILLLIVLVVVAVFTCPSKEMHNTAIMEETDEMLSKELADGSDSPFEKGLAKIGSAIGSSIMGVMLNSMLTVDNYVICSVGKITLEDETQVVSFGMFNYVYTNVPEQLKKELKGK